MLRVGVIWRPTNARKLAGRMSPNANLLVWVPGDLCVWRGGGHECSALPLGTLLCQEGQAWLERNRKKTKSMERGHHRVV